MTLGQKAMALVFIYPDGGIGGCGKKETLKTLQGYAHKGQPSMNDRRNTADLRSTTRLIRREP